jgi:hypothetical protein
MPSSAALASSRIGVPLRARCGLKRGLERLDLVGLMIQKGREDLLERPLPVAEAEALRGWNRVELIVAERRVGAAITIPLGGMGINSMGPRGPAPPRFRENCSRGTENQHRSS